MVIINNENYPVNKTEKLSSVLKTHGIRVKDAKVRINTVSYSVKSLKRCYVRADKDMIVEVESDGDH